MDTEVKTRLSEVNSMHTDTNAFMNVIKRVPWGIVLKKIITTGLVFAVGEAAGSAFEAVVESTDVISEAADAQTGE